MADNSPSRQCPGSGVALAGIKSSGFGSGNIGASLRDLLGTATVSKALKERRLGHNAGLCLLHDTLQASGVEPAQQLTFPDTVSLLHQQLVYTFAAIEGE